MKHVGPYGLMPNSTYWDTSCSTWYDKVSPDNHFRYVDLSYRIDDIMGTEKDELLGDFWMFAKDAFIFNNPSWCEDDIISI